MENLSEVIGRADSFSSILSRNNSKYYIKSLIVRLGWLVLWQRAQYDGASVRKDGGRGGAAGQATGGTPLWPRT